MYKFLLCWRYLRTKYIALASIISVMLGVATMIVVNSVMAGFAHEMQDRLHGILSDLVFEAHSLEGFPDTEWHMQQIRNVAGDDIAGMTPTVAVPAMLSFQYGGNWVTRPVQLIGIDEKTQGQVGDFGKYLQHPENRQQLSFLLREKDYDDRDHTGGDEGRPRPEMARAGWNHRRSVIERHRMIQANGKPAGQELVPGDPFALQGANPAPAQPPAPASEARKVDPFAIREAQGAVFDPLKEQHTGLVMGIALATYRDHGGNDRFLVLPGDDIKLTFPTAGTPPRAIDDAFTVVDFYECKMSEYDNSFVFMPIKKLQELRGMIEPKTGLRYATSIQIRLKDGADGNVVRDKLRAAFPPELYSISTWRDKQGALLAAVQMETAILNVLLFLIIAVAGFGILAIFFMIVVEKTRDIGILKSLGASGRGIMGIFLGYGLSLGLVGSGGGLALGLLFVVYINQIADVLSRITGQQVFDPTIYYFYKIPTIIDFTTIAGIVLGALVIAVLASVLPARRAASLHPVEALRYE
ncbi:MAG TPA: FtsX-like permease family protein [Pirellulales bacterium]|jgi:lipoprotein-releasing system permease protein|nr:FtsX-like permease family protein [Pirellulales bacterium]